MNLIMVNSITRVAALKELYPKHDIDVFEDLEDCYRYAGVELQSLLVETDVPPKLVEYMRSRLRLRQVGHVCSNLFCSRNKEHICQDGVVPTKSPCEKFVFDELMRD